MLALNSFQANDKAFGQLRSSGRKAYLSHSCLALGKGPENVDFDGADVFGGVERKGQDDPLLKIARENLPTGFREKYKVQCFNVYSMLLALGNPKVDLFSLDVEGAGL